MQKIFNKRLRIIQNLLIEDLVVLCIIYKFVVKIMQEIAEGNQKIP